MTVPGPAAPARAADWRTSLSAAVRGVHLQVTPENVLNVRKVLLQEAERLRRFAGFKSIGAAQLVGLCGGDPVSTQAQQAFSERIALMIEQCKDYSTQLRSAGESLTQVARAYGYTEAQIENSFSLAGMESTA